MAGKGGGGAWKVAYADFVTAMMAFFLVMWIVAQNKPVREAIAQYFKNPTDHAVKLSNDPKSELGVRFQAPTTAGIGKAEAAGDAKEDGAGKRGATSTARIATVMDISTAIGAEVLFNEDSAELDEHAKQTLDEIAPALSGKFNKVEVRGHATRRAPPPGSPFKDAWQLSYARSVAAMQYLIDKGIDARRIRLSQSGPNEPKLPPSGGLTGIKASFVEIYVLPEFIADAAELDEHRNKAKKPAAHPPAKAGKPEASH